MKKIIILSIMVLLIFSVMTNVYAASSFKVNMEASKSELTKKEEFTVEVKISDIQDERGIIALGGKIEYDENSLTFVKVEQGSESWAKPSYSQNSKKFAMDRDARGKEDEVLFKIVFTVNEESTKKPKITLKELVGSNGDEDIEVDDVSLTVNVKDGSNATPSITTTPSNNPTPSTTPTTSTTPSSSSKPTQNTDKKITSSQVSKSENGEDAKFPYTGFENNIVLLVILVPAVALAIFSYINIKKINKKAKEIIIK